MLILSNNCSAAGFFGQSLIVEKDGYLSINAEKVDASTLINAWCDMCQTPCTVSHDCKQKISIFHPKTTCTELLEDIRHIADVDMVEHNGKHVFTPGSPSGWHALKIQKRPVAQLAKQIEPLLGSRGKNALMVDVHTNTLWLPLPFYQQHKKAIDALDQATEDHIIILSWVTVCQHCERKPKNTDTPSFEWLLNQYKSPTWTQMLSWFDQLEEAGAIKNINHSYLSLSPGHNHHAKLNTQINQPFYNKKGLLQWQTHWIGLDTNIEITARHGDHTKIHFTLQDLNGPNPDTNNTQAMIDTHVSLQIGHSTTLGAIKRRHNHIRKSCVPVLGRIPILNHLLCQKWLEDRDERMLLIATVLR